VVYDRYETAKIECFSIRFLRFHSDHRPHRLKTINRLLTFFNFKINVWGFSFQNSRRDKQVKWMSDGHARVIFLPDSGEGAEKHVTFSS
jgi:uncharacterized membrane protein